MADAPTSEYVETELGTLPSDWSVTTLEEVSELLQYGTSQRCDLEPKGIPILRIPNVIREGIDTGELKYTELSEKDTKKLKLESGDLLFVRTNGQRRYVGRCAVYCGTPADASFASYLIRARLKPDLVDPHFVQAYCSSVIGKRYLSGRASSASDGKFNINTQILKAAVLPLPSLEEQRAIAGVLRTVQQAKQATEKVIVAARQLKQSLMRHLFTYGPVPFHETDQIELQETDFGEAPQHWKMELLQDCCVVQTGAAKGRRFGDDETIDLPYLRVANVQGGYLDLQEMKTITIRKREIGRYSLQEGDVVLTEGGDFDKLGRGFIWRNEIPVCLHQNHVFAVRADRTRLLPEFVAHQTQSEYGRAYFLSVAHRTTNLACINTTKLKAFPMLIPSISEQRKIESHLEAVDKKIVQEEQKLSALSSAFESLLHGLMSGRIRTTGYEMFGGS